ncbi:UDP-glucose/GDP-mannose dehydrogenase family protein [bacterium]|nr:UDP-glucose/GDP-mannose dehydrogenase family protein [bacterium]
MNLAVVGTGYVGLVAGACFASTGNKVTCVDIDEGKINRLNNGEIPIYEPGLKDLVNSGRDKGRLFFTTDLKKAVDSSTVIFIAVGTPPDEDGSADLQHVLAVAQGVGKAMTDYKVVVDKSTVPVGTADKVSAEIAKYTDLPFDVVSNPEFLKEGAAVNDFLKPDRVVIGSNSERAKEIMDHLYQPFVRTGHPIVHMDVVSAELTKYAANAFLAMKISFMNEMATLCERVGANIDSIRAGISEDVRIGRHFLFAGAGYGGSCFPKDVKAILRTANSYDVPMRLIQSAEDANEEQKRILFKKITRHYGENLAGKTIAVWGLSFKPGTDDMREAPSIVLINALLEAGVKVVTYDPVAMENAKGIFGNRINFAPNEREAIQDADALAIVTEWREFRTPDFEELAQKLRDKVVFDGRNLYEKEYLTEQGLTYYSIGKN